MSATHVSHEGIIAEIRDETISVNLVNVSACGACHIKGACAVADHDNKVIEIPKPNDSFHVGERVQVIMQESAGVKALILGYGVPFLVVLTVLLIASALTHNEAASGLIALASLLPYYLILFCFRKKIQKQFSFSIEKL